MASQVPAKKNTAYNLGLSLYLNTGALVTNPGTITAKISKDFGDYADVGTVTEEDSTYGQIKLALSATEMNADVVMLYVVDNTSGCVPFTCTIYTSSYLNDDIGADVAATHVHAAAADAAVTHADYGNAKLVRSTTPANALSVGATGLVAVPDTQKVDVETIKTRAVTCAAGVTVLAQVGAAGAPGANNGLPTTNGTKINQTVDLTAGQSIACSDKTGFALSATGADLILKGSTFVQAIVAAINEFATYGLTALNTLLVTTGIKAATIPAATLAANQYVNITRPSGAVVSGEGTSVTTFKTNLTSEEDDYIKDAYLKFISGENYNQVKKVSAYNGTTKYVTTLAFTNVPQVDDAFVIINE